MKKLILALLLTTPAWAQTYTRVQHNGASTAASSSTQAVSFTSNPTVNNLLIACGGNKKGGTWTVSDTITNTWTTVQQVANGTSDSAFVAWAINKSTAADTITITSTLAGQQINAFIIEYSTSTTWPATPTDAGNTGTGTASTAVATSNFTTTGTDVIVSCMQALVSQTFTAGTGYAIVDSFTRGADEDQLNAASGTFQGTFTISAADTWAVVAEGFKANAPAGGGAAGFDKRHRLEIIDEP